MIHSCGARPPILFDGWAFIPIVDEGCFDDIDHLERNKREERVYIFARWCFTHDDWNVSERRWRIRWLIVVPFHVGDDESSIAVVDWMIVAIALERRSLCLPWLRWWCRSVDVDRPILFIPEIGKNTHICSKDFRNGVKLTLTSELLILQVAGLSDGCCQSTSMITDR
jgi:hypothetical protein